MQHAASTRGSRLAYLGFSFVLAVLYDIFFWNHVLGANYLFFLGIAILGFSLIAATFHHLKSPQFLVFFLVSIAMGSAPILYNNWLSTIFVPPGALLIALIGALLATLENSGRLPFRFAGIPLLRSIDMPIIKIAQLARDLFIWKGHAKGDLVRKILLAVAISIPLILLFGWLFYKADDIFAQWVRNVIHIEITLELLWRIIRTIAITVLAGGFLYVLVQENILSHREKTAKKFDHLITAIVLAVVNILFATFVFIQVRYLFGSATFVLENGLTFAEYARKGFFELVWIMIFAALLILAVYRAASYHVRSTLVSALQVLLILQVGVIAASAFKRMNLYQDVFGYTVLRLYVEWFIYFVLVLLAGSIVTIMTNWPFRKFFHTGLTMGLLALTIVSLVNVDQMIATENVSRFAAGKKIDVRYVTHDLSIDVMPALAPLFEPAAEEKLSILDKTYLGAMIRTVEEDRDARKVWFEWNRGAAAATEMLQSLPASATESIRKAHAQDDRYQEILTELDYHLSYSNYDGYCSGGEENTYCTSFTQNGEMFFISLAHSDYWTSTPPSGKEMALVRVERQIGSGPGALRELVLSEAFPLAPNEGRRQVDMREYDSDRFNNRFRLIKNGLLVESALSERKHYAYTFVWDGTTGTLRKTELQSPPAL